MCLARVLRDAVVDASLMLLKMILIVNLGFGTMMINNQAVTLSKPKVNFKYFVMDDG
ncbi:MAG: hypothetical protein LKF37_13405 [Lentilactobacillus diolivorans]|nr:hypothetical protein [Lentilactobacillus diolivorans]